MKNKINLKPLFIILGIIGFMFNMYLMSACFMYQHDINYSLDLLKLLFVVDIVYNFIVWIGLMYSFCYPKVQNLETNEKFYHQIHQRTL